MSERKTETVNFRFTPTMKELLRLLAAREHRTQANMVERMVLDYCERNGIDIENFIDISPSEVRDGAYQAPERKKTERIRKAAHEKNSKNL